MTEQLRSQSQARLDQIETRLPGIQNHLSERRKRLALDVICDLRAQINALFAALLVGHYKPRSANSKHRANLKPCFANF